MASTTFCVDGLIELHTNHNCALVFEKLHWLIHRSTDAEDYTYQEDGQTWQEFTYAHLFKFFNMTKPDGTIANLFKVERNLRRAVGELVEAGLIITRRRQRGLAIAVNHQALQNVVGNEGLGRYGLDCPKVDTQKVARLTKSGHSELPNLDTQPIYKELDSLEDTQIQKDLPDAKASDAKNIRLIFTIGKRGTSKRHYATTTDGYEPMCGGSQRSGQSTGSGWQYEFVENTESESICLDCQRLANGETLPTRVSTTSPEYKALEAVVKAQIYKGASLDFQAGTMIQYLVIQKATPEILAKFINWWRLTFPKAEIPRQIQRTAKTDHFQGKFVTRWEEWQIAIKPKPKSITEDKPQPLPVLTEEQRAANVKLLRSKQT